MFSEQEKSSSLTCEILPSPHSSGVAPTTTSSFTSPCSLISSYLLPVTFLQQQNTKRKHLALILTPERLILSPIREPLAFSLSVGTRVCCVAMRLLVREMKLLCKISIPSDPEITPDFVSISIFYSCCDIGLPADITLTLNTSTFVHNFQRL